MRAGERGSGTLYVLAFATLIGLVAAAGVGVGQATLLRHRAGAAADLAALAAAAALQLGEDGCTRAAVVASENGATVAGCFPAGPAGAVEIRVRIDGRLLGGLVLAAVGTARAGPADQ